MKSIVFDAFLLAAQTDGLANEHAREVHVRSICPKPESFTVWKALHAQSFAQPESLPHQPVDVKLGRWPQRDSGQQVKGDRLSDFAGAAQTVWTRISGVESRMILDDIGVLRVPVPVLFLFVGI